MEAIDIGSEKAIDYAYCFDLTLSIHVETEAEADKALEKLLAAADELGFYVIFKELEVAEENSG